MAFGRLLARHLREQGYTLRSFADAVGRENSYISKVTREEVGPPDDFEQWGALLGLKGEARRRFKDEGWTAKCPEPAQHLIRRLKKKLREAHRDLRGG